MALRVLSLGAGVQSSTLLLMACKGEMEKPDLAIFADTGWEPKAVYDWLEFLQQEAAKAGIPVHVLRGANIREDTLKGIDSSGRAYHFASMPFFTKDATGKVSMLKRQCTADYKIHPIRRFIREHLKARGVAYPKPGQVELWMGISADETTRMRLSDVKYIQNVYPLIDRRMDRAACLRWMQANGYPKPPKSSCIGCPFHDDRYWRELKRESPEEFAEAVAFDEAIRNLSRLRDEVFVHRKAIPLKEVRLELPEDQMTPLFDGMADECLGMCGL